MSFTYKYARPALAVDIVVIGYAERTLSLLLIQRGLEPFKGRWALPGGFVHIDETLDEAAYRELSEEAGLSDVYLEQFQAFSAVDRDPRERVVSVAYFALVKPSAHELLASTDADNAKWFPLGDLPNLPFDHGEIVARALDRLRSKARSEPIGFELLPKTFTLTQIQDLYEAILEEPLDKRNFRKKILSSGLIKETDKKLTNVPYRSPRVYRFDAAKYKALAKHGFQFKV